MYSNKKYTQKISYQSFILNEGRRMDGDYKFYKSKSFV